MKKFTFHVIGLPHTQTTKEYISCAYTQKVIKFCAMMKSLGHKIYLYGSEENEAVCDEFISCIDRRFEPDEYTSAGFDVSLPHWVDMNKKVISEIKKRSKKKDFICVIGGDCQKPIADAFPKMMTVEYGIGYAGVFSKYKVFESYAWMHTVYGNKKGANNADGDFYDCVIPNYFDPVDFPFRDNKADFYLYVGRVTQRKGVEMACEICKRMGKRLIIAGPIGDFKPKYGECIGSVNEKQRGVLMGFAKALLAPTRYLEPFGGVTIEANLCGTPVITTDWGAFSENVIEDFNGKRIRTIGEGMEAIRAVESGTFNATQIHDWAVANFSMERVKYLYQAYFEQLDGLWSKKTDFYADKCTPQYKRYNRIYDITTNGKSRGGSKATPKKSGNTSRRVVRSANRQHSNGVSKKVRSIT